MMQNKKLILAMGLLVLVVGAAAFIGGRMLNQKVGPAGLGERIGSGGQQSSFAQLVPAPELPKTAPAVTGQCVERNDNTIVLASVPLDAGGGGAVFDSSEEGEEGSDSQLTSPDVPSGPKVEVAITSETIIYRDTTEPPSGGNETLQETVGEGMLDDLKSDSMTRVWGRKSSDRIIAEVLFYSSPVMIKSFGAPYSIEK